EPVARKNLNLFEFGFEFNRFPPVTGQTGPVNRNRSPAVTGNRLGNKTLLTCGAGQSPTDNSLQQSRDRQVNNKFPRSSCNKQARGHASGGRPAGLRTVWCG